MNGAYPYYDLYNFDYYHGDPYFSSYPSSRDRAGSKRNHYEKDGRSNSKEGKEKDSDKIKGKEGEEEDKQTFQDDFVRILFFCGYSGIGLIVMTSKL